MDEVRYSNVSLVIQGPIDNVEKLDFIEHIPYYKTLFSEIIVSTYTEHLLGNKKFIEFCEDNNIILRHQSINIGNIRNDCRVGYQSLTTYYGLRSVTNSYTLKHRVDERYSNLHILIDKFLENDERWVSSSMLFGPKCYHLFHAGDHLFIAKTDKLLKTFQKTLVDLEKGIMECSSRDSSYGAPEVTFTKNFIRISGEIPEDEKHDLIMLKYFDLVNNSEFLPLVVRENGSNKVFRSLEDFGPNRLQYQTMNDILTKQYLPNHHLWN